MWKYKTTVGNHNVEVHLAEDNTVDNMEVYIDGKLAFGEDANTNGNNWGVHNRALIDSLGLGAESAILCLWVLACDDMKTNKKEV